MAASNENLRTKTQSRYVKAIKGYYLAMTKPDLMSVTLGVGVGVGVEIAHNRAIHIRIFPSKGDQ